MRKLYGITWTKYVSLSLQWHRSNNLIVPVSAWIYLDDLTTSKWITRTTTNSSILVKTKQSKSQSCAYRITYEILWDVITCICPWYLLLAHHSSYIDYVLRNMHTVLFFMLVDSCDEIYYRKTSSISRTLVGNKIVDNSEVVGASPVGAAPTTSSFST